ncbi:Unknown protein [Striga hermonthica]|uniref:Uncharacterized protein n=1 Tax=Striga hermonthica TaxID=68872 RepID=A0A9N7R4G6_STRHE|nr:Unknown protein [Striga hermonthica]
MHLFGGLVVVLGSVAFTLVNMVCFYCKFSGHFENMEGGGDVARDSTLGEGCCAYGGDAGDGGYVGVEKLDKLAMPMSSRVLDFLG